MKLNRNKKIIKPITDYGRFPLDGEYKIKNGNHKIHLVLDEESEMYQVVEDSTDKYTGEVIDIDDFHNFLERHGFIIKISENFN